MGLRNDADIGEMPQSNALELEEACGTRCAAAAIGCHRLEDKERLGGSLCNEASRMLHILLVRFCGNNDLDIDILCSRNGQEARMCIPDGCSQQVRQLLIHTDV